MNQPDQHYKITGTLPDGGEFYTYQSGLNKLQVVQDMFKYSTMVSFISVETM